MCRFEFINIEVLYAVGIDAFQGLCSMDASSLRVREHALSFFKKVCHVNFIEGFALIPIF
jgi:hypothetical protein